MKRTLSFLLVAVASSVLAQTPTVVEKPADKSSSQAKNSQAKTTAKTPATNAKPAAQTVKIVPVQPQKPGAIKSTAAKATAVPVQSVTVKPAPAARTNVPVPAKSVSVTAAKPAVAVKQTAPAQVTMKPSAAAAVRVNPAPVKAVAVTAKPVVATPAAHAVSVSAKPASSKPTNAINASKVSAATVKGDPFKSAAAVKAPAKASRGPLPVVAKSVPAPQANVSVQDNKAADANKPATDAKSQSINTAGRRDPFVSPVVNLGASGSGCSSGKRCLAIDQVALRGVVKSDGGMIAVVVNAMDKAYFLRENDPVFNGYVLKITGDSIVFKETFHDKLGKPLTRDVTKTIVRPVA